MAKKEYKVFKTIDECVSGMAEVRTKLDETVVSYNTTESKEEGDKLIAAIKELRDEYNEYSSRKAIMTCMESEDGKPIMAAIKMSAYPVLKTVTKTSSDTGIKTTTIEDDAALIDFTKFNRAVIPWFFKVEALNFIVVRDICNDLGIELPIDVKKKTADDLIAVFKLSREAAEVAIKEKASKTTIKKSCAAIITDMVGEEYAGKVDSKDVTYLAYNMVSGDKKKRGSIKILSVKWLMKLVADIADRIVNDGVYSADFSKVIRKAK